MLLCRSSLTLLRAQEGVRFESLTFKEALEKRKRKSVDFLGCLHFLVWSL